MAQIFFFFWYRIVFAEFFSFPGCRGITALLTATEQFCLHFRIQCISRSQRFSLHPYYSCRYVNDRVFKPDRLRRGRRKEFHIVLERWQIQNFFFYFHFFKGFLGNHHREVQPAVEKHCITHWSSHRADEVTWQKGFDPVAWRLTHPPWGELKTRCHVALTILIKKHSHLSETPAEVKGRRTPGRGQLCFLRFQFQ